MGRTLKDTKAPVLGENLRPVRAGTGVGTGSLRTLQPQDTRISREGEPLHSGRIFANLDLGRILLVRASSGPPYKHSEFALSGDPVFTTASFSSSSLSVRADSWACCHILIMLLDWGSQGVDSSMNRQKGDKKINNI